MNNIRLKVNEPENRKSIINALIDNGYKVWSEVEKETETEFEDSTYIYFEVSDEEMREEVKQEIGAYLMKIINKRKEEKKAEKAKKEVKIKPLGSVVVKVKEEVVITKEQANGAIGN